MANAGAWSLLLLRGSLPLAWIAMTQHAVAHLTWPGGAAPGDGVAESSINCRSVRFVPRDTGFPPPVLDWH